MPLLDSFKVDHTKMKAPAVRLAKKMVTPHGDRLTVFDLRFCIPNKDMLPPKGMHTFEHLFAGFMRNHLNSKDVEIIDISPMGCRTGFYMSVIGEPAAEAVINAWKLACKDILAADENSIPEANIYQCGSADYHSVPEAREIAANILARGITENRNEDIALENL